MADILITIAVGVAAVIGLASGPCAFYFLFAHLAIYAECGRREVGGNPIKEAWTLSPIWEHRELEGVEDTLEDEVERQYKILKNRSD